MTTNIDDLTSTVFICDNLHFLQSIPSENVGLVCLAPPFGNQQTFEGKLPQPIGQPPCANSSPPLSCQRPSANTPFPSPPSTATHRLVLYSDNEKIAKFPPSPGDG